MLTVVRSIAMSIRRFVPRVNREGVPFIIGGGLLTFAVGFFSTSLFWIFTGITLWAVAFFRDPRRVTPVAPGLVVSPADGRVEQLTHAVPPADLALGERPLPRVSIFMNVFDCHVNRAPIGGRIARISYRPGVFLNAELDKASEDNERNALVIEAPEGRVGVVQIAGLVARRIVCWVRQGEALKTGERFGMIRFGSRLDVYLPTNATILVAAGQRAVAGETPIADLGGTVSRAITHRVS